MRVVAKLDGKMEAYWNLIGRIIKESDLVLEVLDARLVELSRNDEVERMVEEIGRPMLFVVNKSDLVSKKSLDEQVVELKKKGDVVFVNAKKPKDVKVLLYAIKKVFKKYNFILRQSHPNDENSTTTEKIEFK